MSRGFAHLLIITLCGGVEPIMRPLPLYSFRLHQFAPKQNVHNLPQNRHAQKHLPPWQQKAFARTKGRRR